MVVIRLLLLPRNYVSLKIKDSRGRNRCYTWARTRSTDVRGERDLARARKVKNGLQDTYAARAARVYCAAFDWADEAAIEACINVDITRTAQIAALGRLCDALGVSRTVGRHQLVRILYFSPHRHLAQVEVANEMKVTSANVTFLVDGLEKDQLVRRVPSQTDRRTVYVELTEAGELLAERIVPAMARFMARMLDGFTAREKAQLTKLLARLHQNAEAFESRSLD